MWILSVVLALAMTQDFKICDADIVLPEGDIANDINFEDITLEALTSNGVLRGTCADDAHCFVPIDDVKGQTIKLRIAGPSGAVFAPAEYNVDLTTSPNCQSQGEGFTFALKGFGISARVVTADNPKMGPSDIQVDLVEEGSSNVVTTTTTGEAGNFDFAEVTPGKYRLNAHVPEGVTFEKNNVPCEVRLNTDKSCNAQRLVISGFDVTGKAVSYDETLSGVTIFLYSTNADQADKTITDKHPLAHKTNYHVVAKAQTNADGVYTFENLPNGKYSVAATIFNAQTKFKIDQEKIDFVVDNAPLTVAENFKVLGFSIVGRVTNSAGQGIRDVSIILDGQQKVKTNANGNYKLEEEPGHYIIEAQHPDYIFEPLETKIDPSNKQIPDIVVSEYKLCGKIQI